VPQSYEIYTYVSGWDQCVGHPWVWEMATLHYDYNGTYGTSGIAEGLYQNCSGGHIYKVYTANQRRYTSASPIEGSSGETTW